MSVPVRPVEYWVGELAELVRDHVRQTSELIAMLEERITDLEGHVEHGPDGECGVCTPETVGAEVYVLRVDVEDPFRDPTFVYGDDYDAS